MFKKALILSSLLCAACAPMGASGPTLEERVNEQDRELRQIRPQQADTWNEVQAMRQEINELKGQLADLNNAGGARALADRVRQHDAALRQVDNNMALNLELGSPMATATPAYAAPAQQPVQPQTPESSAYARPQGAAPLAATGNYGLPPDSGQTTMLPAPATVSPASPTAPPPSGAQAGMQAPSETTWGQPDPQQAVAVPKKDISLALFDAGLNDYNARKYAEAQRSFTDFVKNYPSHSQMADAQYYIGECDFQRNNFPAAALAYDAVITKYPKSSVAPAAYLKQGLAFSKMSKPDAAKMRMRELISKYPNSPEAARARSFLKTNK